VIHVDLFAGFGGMSEGAEQGGSSLARTGMNVTDVWSQVEAHARKLGAVTPLPGRDM
jgi:hypothetical protein